MERPVGSAIRSEALASVPKPAAYSAIAGTQLM